MARGYGAALGGALSEILGNLAQKKAERLERKQMSPYFESLGFNPQEAMALAALDPKTQQQAIQQRQQQTQMKDLLGLLGQGQVAPSMNLQPEGGALPQTGMAQGMAGLGATQPGQGLGALDILSLGAAQNPQELAKAAQAIQKQSLAERKFSSAEEKEARAETKDFYKETLDKAREATDADKRLKRMEELNEKGALGLPQFNSLIQAVKRGIPYFGVGLDLTSLLTADAQEFEKLSSDFVKGAKKYFGTKLTDADLRLFMQTVPNIAQSSEARRRLINTLRESNDLAKDRRDIMNQIIKKEGRRPVDLESRVEKKLDKKKAKLAQQIKDFDKDLPKYKEGPWARGAKYIEKTAESVPVLGPIAATGADIIEGGLTSGVNALKGLIGY